MIKEIIEVVKSIRLLSGDLIEVFSGYEGDFNESDKENLTQDKYVLPYVFFSLKDRPEVQEGKEWFDWKNKNEEFFTHLGDLTIKFNLINRKDGDYIHWKMVVWNWDKENGILCFSPTTTRMDLHDSAVVMGLTKQKRIELRTTSLELFNNFGEYLKNKINS